MIWPIEFHPAAADEALAAQAWYQQINPQLGKDFSREFEAVLSRIASAPERWTKHLHETRHLLLRRFPYAVVYRQTQTQIQIIAVQHAKRKPGYWMDRIA